MILLFWTFLFVCSKAKYNLIVEKESIKYKENKLNIANKT